MCCRQKQTVWSKNFLVRFNHKLYTAIRRKKTQKVFFARKRYKLSDIIMWFFFLFSATQPTNKKKWEDELQPCNGRYNWALLWTNELKRIETLYSLLAKSTKYLAYWKCFLLFFFVSSLRWILPWAILWMHLLIVLGYCWCYVLGFSSHSGWEWIRENIYFSKTFHTRHKHTSVRACKKV